MDDKAVREALNYFTGPGAAQACHEYAQDIRAAFEAQAAELSLLRGWLCDCFVNSGGDTDGSTDVAALAERAVQAVIDLRRDYDENEDWKGRAETAERRCAELVAVLSDCLAAMDVARDTIQPITQAQLKLHGLNPNTANLLDRAAEKANTALTGDDRHAG